MAWYRTGTVNVTNNSTTVVGVGTAWVQAASVGETFLGPDSNVYEITAINSNTSLSISPAYKGSTSTAQGYAIMPTQGYLRDLAAAAAALVASYAAVRDGAGAGKFPAGTATTPSMRGVADENTGTNLPGSDIWQAVTGGQVRLQLAANGAASGSSVGTAAGNLMPVGAFGIGANAPETQVAAAVDNLPMGSFSGATQTTEEAAVAAGLPALGGTPTTTRAWSVLTLGSTTRTVQYATEVFGSGTIRGRTFVRVRHDTLWHPWQEIYSKNTLVFGTAVGNVPVVGNFGLGARTLSDGNALADLDDASTPSGAYGCGVSTAGTKPSPFGVLHELSYRYLEGGTTNTAAQIFIGTVQGGSSSPTGNGQQELFTRCYRQDMSTPWTSWRRYYSTGNTTVDANGFIKSASPIIHLHADAIESTGFAETESPALEKLGTGVYKITGTSGLAQVGWYIETPQDRNGNKYFNIEWEQDFVPVVDVEGYVGEPQEAELVIRTFERVWNPQTGVHENGDPVDITRYVSLRFNDVRPLITEEVETEAVESATE